MIAAGPLIPAGTLAGLIRYRDHHIATGGFLRAVLSDELYCAVVRADDKNAPVLPQICVWVQQNLPAECYGDPKKVAAWLSLGPTQ